MFAGVLKEALHNFERGREGRCGVQGPGQVSVDS